MFEFVIKFIENILLPLGGWGVFLASILEEVVAPVPSAVVVATAGFVFLQGSFSWALVLKMFLVVVVPSAFGVAVGSLFVYYIAYYFGKPVLEKYGKWLALSWQDIEKLKSKFEKGIADDMAILLFRSLPIVPSVAVSAFCGLTRFNVKKYFIYTFIGTLFRSTILALVGWQTGNLYYKYSHIIAKIETSVLILIALGIIAFIIYKTQKAKLKSKPVL
jgi:membrane protein DedA with SNARE-associated domain